MNTLQVDKEYINLGTSDCPLLISVAPLIAISELQRVCQEWQSFRQKEADKASYNIQHRHKLLNWLWSLLDQAFELIGSNLKLLQPKALTLQLLLHLVSRTQNLLEILRNYLTLMVPVSDKPNDRVEGRGERN